MAAYLTVVLIRECFFFFGDPWVANDCFLVGLWVSYNWAQAGPGTDLVRDVTKQKERKKEKQALHLQAVTIAQR